LSIGYFLICVVLLYLTFAKKEDSAKKIQVSAENNIDSGLLVDGNPDEEDLQTND
jgi:hypothetical protein